MQKTTRLQRLLAVVVAVFHGGVLPASERICRR